MQEQEDAELATDVAKPVFLDVNMDRDKNQDKLIESREGKFSEIQDQVQKLMEGLTSMNVRNAQIGKKILEIKEAIGIIRQQDRRTTTSFEGESASLAHMGQSKDVQTKSAPTGNSSFTRYSQLDFPRFSEYDLES
ncbi:hypothetical protein A4A49_54557 [Nicotiana attenuata]|uniref:Uncharacterized protein n=1 Tax=Nicotiana attenuata TaxID=49451 RepID=A0A314KXS7_NICAT|nr:hypothetical protein A4A49_54557 [Nicotiana attenuata]